MTCQFSQMICRPGLLLPVIKYLVFFDTFVFANSIFFATQFGRKSCFFSRTGFQGYVPISWWVSAMFASQCKNEMCR